MTPQLQMTSKRPPTRPHRPTPRWGIPIVASGEFSPSLTSRAWAHTTSCTKSPNASNHGRYRAIRVTTNCGTRASVAICLCGVRCTACSSGTGARPESSAGSLLLFGESTTSCAPLYHRCAGSSTLSGGFEGVGRSKCSDAKPDLCRILDARRDCPDQGLATGAFSMTNPVLERFPRLRRVTNTPVFQRALSIGRQHRLVEVAGPRSAVASRTRS